jgi:hypothetical protein
MQAWLSWRNPTAADPTNSTSCQALIHSLAAPVADSHGPMTWVMLFKLRGPAQ